MHRKSVQFICENLYSAITLDKLKILEQYVSFFFFIRKISKDNNNILINDWLPPHIIDK